MIILLERVFQDGNYFLSVLNIPHSMSFLHLRFLLRYLLLFWWVYLYMLFDFSFLQPSIFFPVLCANCFNYNMLWRLSVLVISVWCPGQLSVPEWAFHFRDLESFQCLMNISHVCTFALCLFFFFNAHDLQVWSIDGVSVFLHIPFTGLDCFV
jgi:hypothetical protein